MRCRQSEARRWQLNGIEITNCKFIDNNTQNTNKPQVNLTVGGANSVSIENCEFTGAQRTNVGAVAVANMAGIAGDNIVWISGNTIRDHRYGQSLSTVE